NEDGSVWVTFNGEIYNFVSLRTELSAKGHKFRSHTDTEVIVHGYEEWGIECVKRFRGIFAFGIWDKRCHKLWLARDHLGVKPLYYLRDNERFIFASEVKAIIADASVPRKLSLSALGEYLSYGYVPFNSCIYEGMAKLPPGHWLELKNGHITIQEYWDLDCTGEIRERQEATDRLKEALRQSVHLQKVSDVPVGVFLSGG